MLVASCALLLRLGEPLFPTARDVAVLLVLIDGVVEAAHESSVERAAVEDDGVLLVVARVARDRDDGIGTTRHLVHVQDIHNLRLDDGALRRTQHVGIPVQALVVVGGIQSHRLLCHSRLISVTRRLVVVGQRDARRHVTENHMRMNLAVRVCRRDLVGEHRKADDLGFVGINVLNPRHHPVVPVVRGRAGQELAVLDTEHGTHQPTSVRLDENAVLQDIPGDGDVGMDARTPLCLLELTMDGLGRIGVGDDDSVDDDSDGAGGPDILQPDDTPDLLEDVENNEGRDVIRNAGHETHGLDNTDRVTLWSLDRTHEPPR